jgi:type I restriction enzyme S subunit
VPEVLLFSNHLTRIRVDESIVLPRFLAAYIHWNWKIGAFRNSVSQWVSQAAINRRQLEQLCVVLPPLSEQRRIVEIIDQADRLRELRAEADTQAERILPALFLELFGDPIGNPKGWTQVPLGQIGTLERGVSRHRPRNDPSLLGGPYPLIQTGEVTNCDGRIASYSQTYSELGLQQSRIWPPGTLCITIAANIAKTGILEFDACFPDSVVGFSPHDAGTTEFVQAWLSFLQPAIEAKAPGFAQKNINLGILRDLPVIFPPRDLRESFSTQARTLQRLCYQGSRAAEVLNNLFSLLLRRAFTGELTATWREAHMKELLQEMELQAKVLANLEAGR